MRRCSSNHSQMTTPQRSLIVNTDTGVYCPFPASCRVASNASTGPDGMLGPSLAEPEPAWPRALLLGSVYALPYLFRCRAVMLSSIWVFGRVSLAWLIPVRPDTHAGCPAQ